MTIVSSNSSRNGQPSRPAAETLLFSVSGVVIFALVVVVLLTVAFLLQPSPEARREQAIASRLQQQDVVAAARAPDGTTLWATKIGDQVIYFPATSAATDE